MKKLFGKRLKELRIQRKLTQEKIAELIGIKPENYCRIENGMSFPKTENIEKISEILNVKVFELFYFEYLENSDEIFGKVTNLLKNDDEATIITYKFLKSIGKL